MIKNFLLITLRNMAKNKLFLIINILGMGVAIGCCIVSYFVMEYDSTFDHFHKNAETLYRVSSKREFNNAITKFGIVPLPLKKAVSENIKDVERSTRYGFSWSNFKKDDDLFESKMSYVDPEFFDMFTFNFVAGDPKQLKDKTTVMISEKMAERLFGSAREAYGKTITQVYGAELKELKIGGVFQEPPQNSSFYFREAYLNFENAKDEHKDWLDEDWRKESSLFVQITNPGRVQQVEEQLQKYVANNNKVREDFVIDRFVLDHLPGMAHADRSANVPTWTWDAPPSSAIIGSAMMGVLILLIACFNLTNTAIAISSRRLKEIGIRKVMGSMRKQLILQFIGETTFICLLALIVGLFTGELLAKGWNSMWDYMRIQTHYLDSPNFVIFGIALLIFTGILAGSYPAFYISGFEPISILKGKLKFGGTNHFTRLLLGLQFAISLIAIVSAIAFYQNAQYQKQYDLGFNISGTVIAWLNSSDEVQRYRTALQENPKILTVAGANSGIFSNRSHDPVEHDSKKVEVDVISVGDNYLKAMNLSLKEGRDFTVNSETDERESVIVSQRLVDQFGWDKPIGKELVYKDSVKLYVVGVVKDVYTQGLWRELEPLMIRYIRQDKYSQVVVSGKPEDLKGIHEFMEAKWKQLFAYRLYNGNMLTNNFDEVLNVNKNILVMFAFLGFVAMILSATGLFTLVSLNIIKRMKEIGVRKVLGASVGNITRIINTEFIIILMIAAVFGCTLSYFAIDALMGSIWRYYQSSSATTFIYAVFLMFFISVVAIGYKVITAASMNPVNTLRDE